jgi:hypothetical protein
MDLERRDPAAEAARVKTLMRPNVIAELHHLTRTPAFETADGKRDEGWNSRTQAFILALVVGELRIPSAVGAGKACFVVGPDADEAPEGIEVESHGGRDRASRPPRRQPAVRIEPIGNAAPLGAHRGLPRLAPAIWPLCRGKNRV